MKPAGLAHQMLQAREDPGLAYLLMKLDLEIIPGEFQRQFRRMKADLLAGRKVEIPSFPRK